MLIVGAGMAGLIAANYFRKVTPVVRESQPGLPHNHRALLRFRGEEVSTITGIPFRRVFVRKEVISDRHSVHDPTTRMSNAYSYKVTGHISSRSVWNLKNEYRYIAPLDFVSRLAHGVDCVYNRKFTAEDLLRNDEPIISTIPMPNLMQIVGWNDTPEFRYRPIWAVNVQIAWPPVDVYQTLYFPDADDPLYRASITGDHLILEFVREPEDWDEILMEVCRQFGLPVGEIRFQDRPACKLQEYGKIVPIDEVARQEFIYAMTRDYSIYSLGRYATWRQILLDDLVKDLNAIQSLIDAEKRRQRYQRELKQMR